MYNGHYQMKKMSVLYKRIVPLRKENGRINTSWDVFFLSLFYFSETERKNIK